MEKGHISDGKYFKKQDKNYFENNFWMSIKFLNIFLGRITIYRE